MTIMSDNWIMKQVKENQIISPFETSQIREGKISYGLSSFGYDARVADEFKIFTNVNNAVVDPKNFSYEGFVEKKENTEENINKQDFQQMNTDTFEEKTFLSIFYGELTTNWLSINRN